MSRPGVSKPEPSALAEEFGDAIQDAIEVLAAAAALAIAMGDLDAARCIVGAVSFLEEYAVPF